MSRIKEIEDYVRRLYESVETTPRGDEAKQLAADLTTTLGTSIMDKDIDFVLSTLFNSSYGLIRFFYKAGSSKNIGVCAAVSILFGFLVEFIPKRKKHLPALQLYALDLKTQCLNISKTGNSVSRAAAIDLLMTLIDKKNKFDISEFDIPGIYRRFTDLYTLPKTKMPGGVKAKVIELLGKIARYYPEIPGESGLQMIKRWCFDNLSVQMKLSSPESQAVAGYLFCLNNVLYCEEESFQAHMNDNADKLFQIILQVLNKYQDATRYISVQAALELFSQHTALFATMLTNPTQWRELFNILQYWASHHNPQTYKFGLRAFEQYIRQLSIVLHLNYQGALEQQIFRYAMSVFDKHLQNADNLENFYNVSLSIRGVGYFAKACTKIMQPEEKVVVRNDLIKISDWFYSSANSEQKQYLRHIPAFIKAYTLFAAELDPIPVDLMDTLHKMCDIFVKGFVNLSGYHRRTGVFNMRTLFGMLHQKGEGLFRNFLNTLFEQALLCTCTDIKASYSDDRPAYNDMLYFWKVILNNPFENNVHIKVETQPAANVEAEENEEDEEESDYNLRSIYNDTDVPEPLNLTDTLYDSFLLQVLKLTKNFNLKLLNMSEDIESNEGNEGAISMVSTTLRPVNQKDFILFQNLVDFWCLILKELDNKRLEDWVYIVGSSIIDQSVVNPLVSGYYRMMAEIMIVCEKRQFFLGCKTHLDQSLNTQWHGKSDTPAEYSTYIVFREYLKEVWHRLQQFTDELLASCLRLILAYPIAFFDVDELVVPLQKALKLGITYHPLATISMNSLDKLLDPNLDFDINIEFLSQVLPCINEYLLVGVVSASKDGPVIKEKKYKVSTATQRRYQIVRVKMTSDQMGVAKSDYSTLPDLQLRMMQFLGRLGGKNKQLLLQGNDSIQSSDMLAWDPVKRLKVRVPFRNSKIDIYLDEFLPRICELAEYSPDRQVKVAACELLHGLVLFMIGNAAFQAKDTRETTESDYHKLYLKIFPVMLKLAIDPDQVARDMFRLLYTQLIHWLTNNAHSENPETMALLQTCLDAACSADAGLREYGAECIREFVKWSIKQSTRSTDGAMNIKSLLKRLYNLMSNSNSTKRLGAALVFNRIYRLFREESVLVNEYTLEILGQLFLSLKIAEADHPSIGTRDQIIEAISHIKRILKTKISVFTRGETTRRPFIGSENVNDLGSVVEWTFRQSGQIPRTYAKVCLNFFVEFVTHVPGIKSAKDWLKKAVAGTPMYYIDIYEAHLSRIPLDTEDDNHMADNYLRWIKRLNAAVDGYIWLIERNVLDPYDLCCNLDSHLITALQYFVQNDPNSFLQEKLEQSIIEKNRILSVYSHVSVRLIYLLHLMFKSTENGGRCFDYVNRLLPALLYDESILNLISRTLLMPKKTSELIQFDQVNAVTNSSVTRIFDVAKDYVMTMNEKSPHRFMPSLAKSISKTIHEGKLSLIITAEYCSERSLLIEIIQTVDCIKLLQSLDVLQMVCEELHSLDVKYPSNVEEFCEVLFEQYAHYCSSAQDPLFIQILGNSVTIAFLQKGFPENHASELLGFSGTFTPLSDAEKLNIFQRYSEFIFECMAFHFEAFSPVFESHVDSSLIRSYISMFLNYLQVDKQKRRKLIFKFSDQLIKDPTFLKLFVARSDSEDKILDLISTLKLLFGADAGILSRSKKKPIFDILWNAFISFFDKDYPFVIKINALELLPVYICLEPDYRKLIIRKLNESVVRNFPLETYNLEKGSVLYNEYISYLDKLLDTMARLRSADIFNMLIGVFVQEEHHIYSEAIKNYLETFGNGLGLNVFTEVTNTCFTEFKNTENSNLQRRNLCELMISLTVGVDDRAVIAFYEKNIEYILTTIQRENVSSSKQLQDWMEKTDCLRLLQLFDRLPADFFTPNNVIYEKWMNSPLNIAKKRLVAVIIKANADLRKSALPTTASLSDDSRRETQLQYNRAVSNALVSMMIRVAVKTIQTDSIFKEDDLGKFIWDYIVDTQQEIYLRIQWDKPLVKTKLNELRSLSGYAVGNNDQNIIYMASVALTGSSFTQSSLSDMVLDSQTDSPTGHDEDVSAAPASNADTVMTEATDVTTSYGDEANEFELDVLNDNSFMKPMTELIKKLHDVIVKPGEHPVETPVWIRLLLKAFNNSGDKINIQIYIAKLIDNYPFAFAPYASSWFLPLMEFVTKGGKFGIPMNYLVQDLCVILIVWSKNYELPSPRSDTTERALNRFTQFLIKNAYHSDPRIMRSNIQIIKGVFESWGSIIPVPTRALYEQFTHTGLNKPQNIAGLQVLSIVFLNGGNPYNVKYSDIYDISEKTFYMAMAKNISHNERKKRDIAADAAELMGMTINYMRKVDSYLLDELFDDFKDQLELLSKSTKHSSLHFLKCINRVYLRDVPLARELLPFVMQSLRQYAHVEKLLAMQLIGVCWLDDDMIYHTLENAGLNRMISDRDEKMQIATLTVLNKIFSVLKDGEIKKIVKRISKAFMNHENKECRVLYYSFLKKAFSSQNDKETLDEIRALMFQGLTDKDKSITNDLYAYIEKTLDITDDIYDTVNKITREMYIPENEDSYLLYTTCMILNNTKKSYEFDQPIFDKPLPNARFDADYQHINTSWQTNSSMLPLFKATQTQAINPDDLELELNQTQSLLDFSVTQGSNRSLLSTFNPETDNTSKEPDADPDDQDIENSRKLVKREVQVLENPYNLKRKRFNVSAPGASNRFHSERNQRLEKKMRNLKNTFQEISEKKVRLTRSYRVGELPDVQINYKDLLLPLEVLASSDYNISRLLYSSLVVGIVSLKKTEDVDYENIIVGNIQQNINDSTLYFAPTIGSFLRIFFDLNITDQPESLVRNACSKSSNHHIGIALLEKQLDIISAPLNSGKRKYKYEDDDDDVVIISSEDNVKRKNLWIDLGLLYKEIDEPEIFQSIYLTNVTTEKLCIQAINYELNGQYNLAFNKYKTAAEMSQENYYESTVWTEEMLHCYTQLCQWDDIYANIEQAVGDNTINRIWDSRNKDTYLKYYVRSISRERAAPLGENMSNLPIVRFYEEAEIHEDRKELLLKYYANEWSSVCILRKQYDLGSQLIQNSYDSLLSAWTTLHPLAHTSRLNKLSQLQRTVEIEDYLKLLKKLKQGIYTVDQAETFFDTLTTRYPDRKSDPIDIWDDLIESRSIFIRDLLSQNDKIVKNEMQMFEKYNVIYNSAMADTAIDQKNSTVGSHLMKRLNVLGAETESQLCKIQLSEALFKNVPDHKKPELLSNGLKQSSLFQTEHADASEAFRSKLIVAKPYIHAKSELLSDPTLFDKMTETRSLKYTFRNNLSVISNADIFINYLESVGFDKLLEAGESVDKNSTEYAEYLWKLGNYCDTSLRSVEFPLSTLQPDIDTIQYSKLIIKYYIEAMDMGHREAIENFPRVLDLIDQYPECGPVFEDTINNLSSIWRLIRWIPQMISFIETPVAKYVLTSLTRISESYPKAIYYHFQMYFEHYDLKKEEIPEENRAAIEKIRHIIRSPIMEEFTMELQRLTNPEHLLKDFADVIKTIIIGQNAPASFIDSVYNQIEGLLLNVYSSRMGQVPKSFCAKNRKRMEEVFGRKGQNLHKITPSLITKLDNMVNDISNDPTNTKKPAVLKSYSPWLASFKSSEFDEELEIPGQYDGLSKPYPELHAKVASFNGALLVMDSIRKPKKIIINGSDEKDYSFLVKGGEDLRLDQRIEQLFTVMNGMLKRDAFCAKQDIQIATYKVIPMSLNLGIIEWVDSTRPLKSCLDKDRKSSIQIKQAQQSYNLWVTKSMGKRISASCFTKLFAEDRKTIIQNYDKVTANVSPTLLKDTILQLSSSPEAFLFMRKRFAYSLACISIFGYLLGVGDRHLENFLLNMKSGLLIPIDFGHAFGSATELLPVPEIVPFRLTPQLQGVLEPLGISGILEYPMVAILNAIQNEKNLLLNIMNVFIKDPLLDWKKAAIKQKGIQKGKPNASSSNSTESLDNTQMTAWYPQKKLEAVKRKLNGENPAAIVSTEIYNGHSKKNFIDHIIKMAKGDPEHDIRAQVGDTCKDTTEQVKCLINLATDKSVLGVMWSGWSPYL